MRSTNSGNERIMNSHDLANKLHRAGVSSLKGADFAAEHIEKVVGGRFGDIHHKIGEIERGLQDNKGNHLSHGDIRRITDALSGK